MVDSRYGKAMVRKKFRVHLVVWALAWTVLQVDDINGRLGKLLFSELDDFHSVRWFAVCGSVRDSYCHGSFSNGGRCVHVVSLPSSPPQHRPLSVLTIGTIITKSCTSSRGKH